MNAQQMFESLGWVKQEDAYNIEYGYDFDFTRQYERGKVITFSKIGSRSYETAALGRHYDMFIDVALHQAITQQMKELGWL
jgi:hypothetical protein